jgi:hypothetical protein
MKRYAWVGLVLLGAAVAASTSYSLVVNGQVSNERAIVVNGKTYVPITVLKSLGVTSGLKGTTLTLGNSSGTSGSTAAPTTTAGGANARAGLEGCVGETLFNGVWRLKVVKLEPISKGENQPGWGVTLELRNGTKVTTAVYRTGLTGINLVLPNGNALTFDEYEGQAFTHNDLAQAAGVTTQLKFYFPSGTPAKDAPRPEKLVVQFDPAKLWEGVRSAGVAFTTPTPSLRVKLDCTK